MSPTPIAPQINKKQDSPVLPPVPGQKQVDPELQKKYQKVDTLLKGTAKADLGKIGDKALEYVKKEFSEFAKRNTEAPLSRAEQLDKLTQELRADGVFDMQDIQKLQAFQQGQMEPKGAATTPVAVTEVGKGIQFAEQAMKEGSTTRETLKRLNPTAVTEKSTELLAGVYKDVLRKMHTVDQASKK